MQKAPFGEVQATSDLAVADHGEDASSRRQDCVNLPSSKSIKRASVKMVQVDVPIWHRLKRFARVPADVLISSKLSPADKLVLAAMGMESFSDGRIAISHLGLARLCSLGRSTVFRALRSLEKEGLIARLGGPIKQVQAYRLLHPIFAGTVTQEGPIRVKTARRLLRCAKCNRDVRGLSKAGWCRICMNDLKLGRKIDHKLDERGVPRKITA